MLDEYWKYSIFSGVMILVFEAVTVFTRLKSMKMIRGMGNKSRDIFVYRYMKFSSRSLINIDMDGGKRSQLRNSPQVIFCLYSIPKMETILYLATACF